jgi:hypothetical protein
MKTKRANASGPLLIGLLALASTASAQTNPYGHAYGINQNEWSVAWVQWIMSIPLTPSPLLDTTGASCAENQSGKVWFLAGDWVEGPVVRECYIPAGKSLFFPVANYFWVVTHGDANWPYDDPRPRPQWKKSPVEDADGNIVSPNTVQFLRDTIAQFLDTSVLEHGCTVDGVAVPDTRVAEPLPLFHTWLPRGNIFDNPPDYEVPAGTYRYSMQGGWYVMLEPLSPGVHEIHITADLAPAGPSSFDQDVLYILHVVGK